MRRATSFVAVKSLRPVSLSETKFDKHGLVADRRLMIVRPSPKPLHGGLADGEATHRFLTQRQSPSLATIEATGPVEATIEGSDGRGDATTQIKLSSSLVPATEEDGGVCVDVHPSHVRKLPIRYLAGLWDDVVEVADAGDEAAAFVSKVAAKDDPRFADARVVSIVESSVRNVSALYCPDAARVGPWGSLPQGGLTDGFPVSAKKSLVFFLLFELVIFVGLGLAWHCSDLVIQHYLSDSGRHESFFG